MKNLLSLIILIVFTACTSSGSSSQNSTEEEVSFAGVFASMDGDSLKIIRDEYAVNEGIEFDLMGANQYNQAMVFNTVELTSRDGDLDVYHFEDKSDVTYTVLDFIYNAGTGDWEINDIGYVEQNDTTKVDFSGVYKRVK